MSRETSRRREGVPKGLRGEAEIKSFAETDKDAPDTAPEDEVGTEMIG